MIKRITRLHHIRNFPIMYFIGANTFNFANKKDAISHLTNKVNKRGFPLYVEVVCPQYIGNADIEINHSVNTGIKCMCLPILNRLLTVRSDWSRK